jgi:predicted RNA binding protein YcfA (HicA-like mRNA interferase family)
MEKTPAVTGKQLLKLLVADGWEITRRAKHGIVLRKTFSSGTRTTTRITLVKNTKAVIPDGTLGSILGPKQTGLGKAGLRRLMNRYGL